MSHDAELALLLLESVLEGQDAGSLLPVDLLVVHDQDHGGGIHGLSCTFIQINQGDRLGRRLPGSGSDHQEKRIDKNLNRNKPNKCHHYELKVLRTELIPI